MKMATGARKGKASILDDRIDILNSSIVEASAEEQISRTVVDILILVRVSARSVSVCELSSVARLGQDD